MNLPTEFDRPLIVDSTLREGEQFSICHFSSDQRLSIARALDRFGVDIIEMTSPAASPRSAADLARVAGAGLRARVVTHVRCHEDDLKRAIDCGVDGVHLLFGTSHWLREHSHGRDISRMLIELERSLDFLQERGVSARFSCEDAFRTDPETIIELATQAVRMGATRIGLADTVGCATPQQVGVLVGAVRTALDSMIDSPVWVAHADEPQRDPATGPVEIEFHGHNDGGCAIANAHAAWRAGATHLDTTLLGIGERNGIASLSGLVALLYLEDPGLCADFDLPLLPELDEMVADMLGIAVPFNACITAPGAFTHKAGMHTKAILSEPRCYEALDPAVFGRTRDVLVGHHLTGRHAVGQRALDLGLVLSPEALVRVSARIKTLADEHPLLGPEVDALLHAAASPAAEVPA